MHMGYSRHQLLRDLAATIPVSLSKARNTLALLKRLEIVREEDGRIWIAGRNNEEEPWDACLARHTAQMLAERIVDDNAVSCIQSRGTPPRLWLDSMVMPGVTDGLTLWVTEFSVATRDKVGERFWEVAPQFVATLLSSVRYANAKRPRRAVSADQLQDQLAAQAEQGLMAEEWVLKFERARLSDHPLVDQVRRVSSEDVGAGYDIVSFSETGKLRHDLFIEVKSFRGTKRFFWTRNELATAEEFGEEYALYLVDFSEMNSPNYQPHVITGPYWALLESPESGWQVSPTTFECVAPITSDQADAC